jgi:hypothetical protein
MRLLMLPFTRTFLLLFAAWFLVVAALAAQQGGQPDRLERAFISGGTVRMDLSAGGYRIEGTNETDIRIRWRTRDPDDMRKVRAQMQITGREAAIHIDGPSNNFQGIIQLPERSDIVLRVSAGEIDVRALEGSKDIDMWAGDITVAVGEPERYGRIDTSVRAGDITANPFGVTKSGLFRSFSLNRKGPYTLRVKLVAGDLKLVR